MALREVSKKMKVSKMCTRENPDSSADIHRYVSQTSEVIEAVYIGITKSMRVKKVGSCDVCGVQRIGYSFVRRVES